MSDVVNHPPHYLGHASGYECIEVAELLPYRTGNVIKYTWRAGKKEDRVEDLDKAVWYLHRIVSRPRDVYFGHESIGLSIREMLRKVARFERGVKRDVYMALSEGCHEAAYGLMVGWQDKGWEEP